MSILIAIDFADAIKFSIGIRLLVESCSFFFLLPSSFHEDIVYVLITSVHYSCSLLSWHLMIPKRDCDRNSRLNRSIDLSRVIIDLENVRKIRDELRKRRAWRFPFLQLTPRPVIVRATQLKPVGSSSARKKLRGIDSLNAPVPRLFSLNVAFN